MEVIVPMIYHFHQKLVYFMKEEINEIFITNSIRSFALSMISVFVPIFFLKMGYSLQEVLLFYVLYSLIVLSTVKYFVRFATIRGVKKSIFISMPVLSLFFFGLHHLDQISNLIGRLPAIYLLGAIQTISALFYYMGFHVDFARVHKIDKAAKQISTLNTASILLSIAGPVLGAFIISFTSFEILFSIIFILLIAGTVPLFFSKETVEEFPRNINRIFTKSELKRNLPYLGEGFRNVAAAIFWPIMLYVLSVNIEEIGVLYTFTNVLVALLTIYLGHSRHNQHKVLDLGTALHSISLVVRTMLSTITSIAAVQGLGAISFAMIRNPYLTFHYNKSKMFGIAHNVYAREMYLHLGKVINLIILIILLNFTSTITSLSITIIIGGLMTFLMRSIRDN